jgi:hypothetical protein
MPVKSGRKAHSTAQPQAISEPDVSVGAPAAPVVVLSYAHSGAGLVQQALADGTDLTCTTATGILPLCEAAAATWAQVDNRPGIAMSQMAAASIHALVSTQLTMILAADGGKRWCELATSAPSTARTFMHIFPAARFVCVHRAWNDVIAEAIASHPWGLTCPTMSRFTASYPGNSVAAAAAYWASATEQLLEFATTNSHATYQVCYDHTITCSGHGLDDIRSSLGLNHQSGNQVLPGPPESGSAGKDHGRELPQVPADLIPAELRRRIDHLHAQLNF